jgi:hypothetical protein
MPVPEIPTMYPPLAQLVFRATWRLLPDPVGFKLPFLLADLGVAAMLAGWIRSTGGRNYQVAIYAWNPLGVVEFASSGHNDALAIAGVVATLMIIRRAPAMSTLTLTAGAQAKASPAVLLPLAFCRAGWPGKLRGWLPAGYGSGYTNFSRTKFSSIAAPWTRDTSIRSFSGCAKRPLMFCRVGRTCGQKSD